ncbi:hypothetical protein DFJ74DRAFT_709393 [Hyaloraphidium curvatum]|nr:hypothetical protein DFJ74DRAFT_709393 [Hyaloraphidium curvatum]
MSRRDPPRGRPRSRSPPRGDRPPPRGRSPPRPPPRQTTLFVSGLPDGISAREVSAEFERFGRLVRCDVPTPRYAGSDPFAFVEFEEPRDAEGAYQRMEGKRIGGGEVKIQVIAGPRGIVGES